MRFEDADALARALTKQVSILHRRWYPLVERLSSRTRLRPPLPADALEFGFGAPMSDADLITPQEFGALWTEGLANLPRTIRRLPIPRVGIGVSRGERADDWRLAVRAWTPDDLALLPDDATRGLSQEHLDVRITGVVRTLTGGAPAQRRRPLEPGCSIGHYQITAGTLGAFVQGVDGRVLALSNNHVLTNQNRRTSDDWIIQPGLADGGVLPNDRVGELSEFIRLTINDNVVDAAVAVLDDPLPVQNDIPGVGPLRGICPAADLPGLAVTKAAVRKVGRSTQLTSGRIRSVALRNLPIAYETTTRWFGPVLEIESADGTPFSQPGDSGSLVVDDQRRAVGLLFAGDKSGAAYLNPVASVLEMLHISFI